MASARINQAFLQRARHAPGFHWDSGPGCIRGFGVRVGKDGSAISYVFQKRGANRKTIARVDAMDLAAAREAAHALAAKRPTKAAPSCTLEEAMNAHLESMRVRGCSARSTQLLEYEVRRYAAKLLDKRLDRVTHDDIAAVHRAATLGETKRRPVAANRVVRHLSAIFGSADVSFPLRRKWWRDNRNRESQEGTAPVHDLAAFGAALAEIDNPVVVGFWRFSLVTGLRLQDCLTIRREDVNAKRAGWLHRPSPKGGEVRAFQFPLSSQARAIVDQLPVYAGNPHLFPSARKAGGHLTNPGNPAGAHAHQMRATFISRAAELGCPLSVIQRLVNHSGKRDITSRYITVNDKVLALWSQRVADSLWADIEVSAGANENAADKTENLQDSVERA